MKTLKRFFIHEDVLFIVVDDVVFEAQEISKPEEEEDVEDEDVEDPLPPKKRKKRAQITCSQCGKKGHQARKCEESNTPKTGTSASMNPLMREDEEVAQEIKEKWGDADGPQLTADEVIEDLGITRATFNRLVIQFKIVRI